MKTKHTKISIITALCCILTSAVYSSNDPNDWALIVYSPDRSWQHSNDTYFDPRMDLRLSKYPIHPCPPIYNITFPNRQKMLILGTTHTIPLGCILPYNIAHDIINASDFVIEEINGEILPGMNPKISQANHERKNDDNLTPYITESLIQKIKLSLEKNFKKFYMNDDGTEKRIGAQKAFESKIDQDMNTLFDSSNCWYEKADIFASDDDMTVDFGSAKFWKESYPKKLKIKGKIAIVPSRNGKELHPLALEFLYRTITGEAYYIIPACGGMDDHLQYISLESGKKLYAFEEYFDRYECNFDELLKKIEECENGFWTFKLSIESLKSLPDLKEQKSKSITFASTLKKTDFYSTELKKHNSSALLNRNDIWIQRIMALNSTKFKHAFAYVGNGHLHDLFEKLTKLGFTISNRLSLAELEEINSTIH